MTTSSPQNYADPQTGSSGDLVPVIMRMLRMIRYRKHVLYASVCIFGVLGVVYYFTATRLYQASAKLLIVEQKLDKLSAVGDYDNTGNTMATHRELVISPVVIAAAIQKLEPQHRIDLMGVPPQDWVEAIAEELDATITRKTNFIEVDYRSRRPETAVAVVRAVIQSYLEFVEKHHKGTAGDIITVLTEERDRNQHTLDAKKGELQAFRQQVGHLAVSADDRIVEPLIQRAVKLNEILLVAKERRLNLQTTLSSVQQAVARGEDINQHLMSVEENLGRQVLLSSMGLGQEDLKIQGEQRKKLLEARQELQNLSADYGPNHPRILELHQQIQNHEQYLTSFQTGTSERFAAIGETIPSQLVLKLLEQSVAQALEKEQQLDQAFEEARTEAVKHSNALVHLEMLEREVTRNEELCASLAQQIATIDTNQIQAPIKATVVREPLPDHVPVSPQMRFLALACLMGGSMVGGIIIYIQDVLDDRFHSPEEMATQLGVPILAMIQKLSPLPGEGIATIHAHALPYAVETEAFRTLRTALSLGNDTCNRMLITSSEPGDGKTTVSANLAVTFAQAGKRTLLVDADLRRPGFTTLLQLKGLPGVADILTSGQPAEIAAPPLVQLTDVEGLEVLPVGFRRPNPSELLSSKEFIDLLAWADSQYDRVIVDCPPVLAVSDAQVVGQLVDGAVLVVRPDKNHRRSVIRALDTFQSSGCRVLGVVANSISKETGGYGYGYGYNYEYGSGYGHTEETANDAVAHESPVKPRPRPATIPLPRSGGNTASNPPRNIRPRRAA